MKSHVPQVLSRTSFFVGLASLAGWLFFFVLFMVGELNEVTPLPEVILYSAVGGAFSLTSLGVIGFVPAARNTHGLAALAAVIIAVLDFAFLIYTFEDIIVVTSQVLTGGVYGGFQTLAALTAFILAALSFPGMKGTKVFGRRDAYLTTGEGQSSN